MAAPSWAHRAAAGSAPQSTEAAPAPVAAAPGQVFAVGARPLLATRGSALALAQARLVQAALSAADGTAEGCAAWSILPITTRGDRSATANALSAAGGAPALAVQARTNPGLFTAEVAAAVRDGAAQAAVHSLKDLPLEQPPGLCLAAILPRAAAHDVLVVAPGWFAPAAPLGLRPGAAVGTSSPRRAALLRHHAPAARATAVRGNVPTRLRRCREGGVAALLLAAAGLQRLGAEIAEVADLHLLALPPERWAPAPGQGAVAVQARAGSTAATRMAAIDHAVTRTAVTLERALLQALGGGCAAACGAFAEPAAGAEWVLHYGFAHPGAGAGPGGWRSYRLRGSAAACRQAIADWGGVGPPPGEERTGTGQETLHYEEWRMAEA